jgi:hypothetical protein
VPHVKESSGSNFVIRGVHGLLHQGRHRDFHRFLLNAPAKTEAADTDYRIVYSSRDKERNLDVTDLGDEEFVSFMKSQPAKLYEIRPFE